MDDIGMQNIWNNYNEREEKNVRFSINDIKEFRKKYSAKTTLTTQRLIILDSIYKILVITGYGFLLLMGEFSFIKIGLSSMAICLLLFLVLNNISIIAHINKSDESKDVISVLKLKYDFLNRFYREFLYIASITHPFFVLAGFQFYHYFKYGNDRLIFLLNDPVTFVFLILAFIIPFITQKISYNKELQDLEQIIDLDLDEVNDEITLLRIKGKKKSRQIILIILILIGLLVLLSILNFIL